MASKILFVAIIKICLLFTFFFVSEHKRHNISWVIRLTQFSSSHFAAYF